MAYMVIGWKTPELMARAALSVTEQRPDAEVMICEASIDGLGYSQAINRSLGQLGTRPEIVVACNADVEMLESDDPVLALFDRDPDLTVVGPRQVNADGLIVHGGIVPYDDGTEWDLDLRHRCWMMPLADADELTSGTFQAPTVAGSVMYLRRSALLSAGGFPEWTRAYYEDTFVCYRARQAGQTVLYTGAVTWRHLLGSSPLSPPAKTAMLETARRRFVLECERAGIPLRVWPDDHPQAMERETVGLA